MRYDSMRHFRTTSLSRDSFSVRLVGKAAWKALKLVVLMKPLEPTSMVISLEQKPASLQETSSSEYLLVFLATAPSKQSSKGTVSSMMVIADWSHTTRSGRLSVRAICCGKLYWRLGRSAVTFWGWWQQLLQEDVDGLKDAIMSVVCTSFSPGHKGKHSTHAAGFAADHTGCMKLMEASSTSGGCSCGAMCRSVH